MIEDHSHMTNMHSPDNKLLSHATPHINHEMT